MSGTPPPPAPPPPPSEPPGNDPTAHAPPPPAPAPRLEPPAEPPPVAPSGDQPLAPGVVTLWRLSGVIPMAVLLAVTLAVAAGLGGPLWVLPVLVLGLAIWVIGALPALRYRRWRWRVTDRALELEHGVLFRQVRALPYFRIQHIDVEHGPLDRSLGLARLEVHTASVTATLPGLDGNAAPRVRSLLLARAAASVASDDRGDDAV